MFWFWLTIGILGWLGMGLLGVRLSDKEMTWDDEDVGALLFVTSLGFITLFVAFFSWCPRPSTRIIKRFFGRVVGHPLRPR